MQRKLDILAEWLATHMELSAASIHLTARSFYEGKLRWIGALIIEQKLLMQQQEHDVHVVPSFTCMNVAGCGWGASPGYEGVLQTTTTSGWCEQWPVSQSQYDFSQRTRFTADAGTYLHTSFFGLHYCITVSNYCMYYTCKMPLEKLHFFKMLHKITLLLCNEVSDNQLANRWLFCKTWCCKTPTRRPQLELF